MNGEILDFDHQSSTGFISGEDGNRYRFGAEDWRADVPRRRGTLVDFVPAGDRATEIYLATSMSQGATQEKSKIAAALLALFLGGLGVHKFYLGYVGAGIVMLIGTFTLIFIPVVVLIALIEFIVYITKSDVDFHQTYVVNNRSWF